MTEENTAQVPAVYKGMYEVLKALEVEKNGTLPSNMSGKAYMTAVDINNEVKRLFVANNLIHLPIEKQIAKEVILNANRLQVTLSIEGTYTIVSLVDGSTAVIGGIGDGIASGSAVAASIASTFALKNALQRTFLITEQSVEDAGKTGPADEKPTKAEQKVAAAKAGTAPATGAIPTDEVKELQTRIKAAADARRAVETDFPTHMQFATKFLGNESQGWSKDTGKLQRVLQAIEGGVVA